MADLPSCSVVGSGEPKADMMDHAPLSHMSAHTAHMSVHRLAAQAEGSRNTRRLIDCAIVAFGLCI